VTAYWTDKTAKADGSIVHYGDTDAYVATDGTTYPGQYDKALIPGLIPVTMAARPDETPAGYTVAGEARGGVTVTGWHVALVEGVPTQVWDTEARPEMTVDEAKAVALPSLSAACAAAIEAGFRADVTGATLVYTLSSADQANLDAAYQLAQMAAGRATAWTAGANHALNDVLAANGDYVLCTRAGSSGTAAPAWPTEYQVEVADGTAGWSRAGYLVGTSDGTLWVSAAEATALWVASKSHITTCRALYRTAKAAIDAATTMEAVTAIIAAVKWP